MRYLSVCSGIEAASVAWHTLNWSPVAFAEIEDFPSRVLSARFPSVPNLGDMTKFKDWNIERNTIDIIVGGTPCQAFSVAGMRQGLADERGNLTLRYVEMVNHFRPEWIVWENVPGVLSSNGGRDFGTFIGALADIGYGFAWRVLDAQHFGVPQRRRRVYLIGHNSGDAQRAGKVLFESEGMQGDHYTGQQASKITAGTSTCSTISAKWSKGTGGPSGDECQNLIDVTMYQHHPQDTRIKQESNTCQTVTARWGTGGGNTPIVNYAFRKSARAQTADGYETWVDDGIANTLNCFDTSDIRSTNIAMQSNTVRRLTPIECERLQGFPDDWTNVCVYRCCGKTFSESLGKYGCPNCNGSKSATLVPAAESSRYKAIGNSMAVPVMKWIGERIDRCR